MPRARHVEMYLTARRAPEAGRIVRSGGGVMPNRTERSQSRCREVVRKGSAVEDREMGMLGEDADDEMPCLVEQHEGVPSWAA